MLSRLPPDSVAWRGRRAPRLLLAVLLAVVLAATAVGACAVDDVPMVPVGADGFPDLELVTGRQVYIERCANCHGNDGRGGRGTRLSEGRMIERYPEVSSQVRLVADGVRAMPAFADILDDEEILAVVRYTREVL